MAIVGIGTDIVEISRIEAVIGRTGDRFAKRILSEAEWDVYLQHKQPARFLAKRFAVKEAASKALGTGIRQGLAFNQFEVSNDSLGKPNLAFLGYAGELAAAREVTHYHVSIADEHHYACATVILETNSA